MSQDVEVTKQSSQPAVIQISDGKDKAVNTLATGAGVLLIGKLAGRGIHAFGQVILARLLGPELFGLYALGWTALRLGGSFAPLGLDRGVIRFASEHWRKNDAGFKSVLFQSVGLAFLSGSLVGIAAFFSASWLEEVFRSPGLAPVLRGFAFAFPLLALLKVLVAATQVSQRMQFTIYAEEVGQPITNLILIVLFYVLGWKLFGAVAAAVISFGFGLTLTVYYVLRLFPELLTARFDKSVSVGQLIIFSLPTAIAAVFTMFTNWTDRLFIGYFRPASEVGIYQALSQSSLLFAITLRAIGSIFLPMIADLYQQGAMERLEELYRVSTKWALYLSIPLFLLICFAPEELMLVVFGGDYISGALPLVILATGQIINVATGSVGFILIMTDREKQWLVISGIALFINLILNWFLVPRLGLIGSALSTATAISLLYVPGLVRVRQLLGLWPYDRRYLKGLVATGLTVSVLVILQFVTIDNSLLRLLVTTGTAGGTFVGILWLLGLDDEDREFITVIQARIGGKLGKQ